jgi:hypothetical protein
VSNLTGSAPPLLKPDAISQRLGRVMDDEKFKKEVLAKLDKISTLLSISCAVANGSLEKAKAEMALRQVLSKDKQGDGSDDSVYLLRDEMQDDYAQALEKWKAEKNHA